MTNMVNERVLKAKRASCDLRQAVRITKNITDIKQKVGPLSELTLSLRLKSTKL